MMAKVQIAKANNRPQPPGRIKIAEALRSLLAEKEFSAITTAEIAKKAGVTEALIYKYFQDKRDLLHQVLREYLENFLSSAEMDVRGVKGALNKLRKLIWSHIHMYADNRVFARILLLEVRNYPDYFNSDAYQIVRRYSKIVRQIVKEGIEAEEIRSDLSVSVIGQAILGGIEHVCFPGVIFNRDIEEDKLTEELCELIFNGIARRGASPRKGST
jgi:TetR/AcrR family fatty acid metabolism transcriptional regulator